MIVYWLSGLTVVLLLVVAANPKIGVVLVWPVVFLYPHLYMENLELLPWNIGIDDIYICVFFLIVVVRCNLVGGTPVRAGVALFGIIAFCVLVTLAHLSGWRMMPELPAIAIIKPMLKAYIFPLYVYCLLHTIDNERDVRRAAAVYLGCMVAGAVTVILQKLFPHQMMIFAAKEALGDELQWQATLSRTAGALQNANVGCSLLGMASLVAMIWMRAQAKPLRKLLLAACVVVMFIGMVLTGSRGGTLGLVFCLALMTVLSRHRLYASIVIALGIGFVSLKPELFVEFADRIADIYSAEEGGIWGKNVQRRFDLWRSFADEASIQVWVFGQSRTVGTIRHGLAAHNAYLSALFNLGIGGLTWVFVFFGILCQRCWRLIRMRIEPYASLGAGLLWAVVAMAVAGISMDMVLTQLPLYTYLFYAVLIERSYALAKQTAANRPPGALRPASASGPGGRLLPNHAGSQGLPGR